MRINKLLHFAGLIGTYCAGIDEKLNYDLFNTYVDILKNPKYTNKLIKPVCKKYKQKTQNVRFVAIYDFMTKNDIDNLSQSNIDTIRQILASDLDVYNRPREWVQNRFPKQVIDQEPYVFPFSKNDSDSEFPTSGPFDGPFDDLEFPTSGPFGNYPIKSSPTKDVSIQDDSSSQFPTYGPFSDDYELTKTTTIGGKRTRKRKSTKGRKLTKGRKSTKGRKQKRTKKKRSN